MISYFIHKKFKRSSVVQQKDHLIKHLIIEYQNILSIFFLHFRWYDARNQVKIFSRIGLLRLQEEPLSSK